MQTDETDGRIIFRHRIQVDIREIIRLQGISYLIKGYFI